MQQCADEQQDIISQARQNILSRQHNTWEEIESCINSTFDILIRAIRDRSDKYGEAEAQSMRNRLKEASTWWEAKLDNTRKAGEMKLSNQAVAMEAAHVKKFEDKVASLVENGDELTKDLHRQVHELTAELVNKRGVEDRLNEVSTPRLLRPSTGAPATRCPWHACGRRSCCSCPSVVGR